MTTDPHYREQFGGIDGNVDDSGRDVPGVYRATLGDVSRGESVEFPTFHEVLGELRDRFGVAKRAAYYHDEARDEYVEVPNRAVLVNPAWLGDGLDEAPQNSAAWTTASDEYSETDAMDNYGPLVAAARQAGYPRAFGEFRAYRNGGEVNADVFFRGLEADDPEDDAPRYVLGFETGYDHFRRQSVYASIIALDVETNSVLRGLSERFTATHRGDPGERLGDWFVGMFDRAEKVGDTLYEVVAEAREYEVHLAELPLSTAQFYDAVGFAPGMSSAAAERVRNHRKPSAWDLYEPITHVLTAEYDGKIGGRALQNHASRANELLYSPARSEQAALEAAADELEGQETLLGDTDEDAADVLRDRADSLDDAVESSLSFRKRVRAILDADDAAEQAAEADGGAA